MQPENTPLAVLIDKYLNHTCSPAEEAILLNWINQIDVTTEDVTVNEYTGKLLKLRIDKGNGMDQRGKMIRLFRPLRDTAASILIAAALGMLLYMMGNRQDVNKGKPVFSKTVVHQHFKKLINNGHKPVTVRLEDGSAVNLQVASSQLWEVPFATDTRKIELTGKAFFKVAKNKQKPFIVYSGDISTTALGTSFWVKEQPHKGDIEVELITGKIVIKHYKGGLSRTLAYLTPGQQLTYSLSNNSTVVINKIHPSIKKTAVKRIIPPVLVFTSTPLAAVFAQLEAYYHIKIEYNPQVVSAMTFYGSYTEKDSVETILNTIATANGLTLNKLSNTFIISD